MKLKIGTKEIYLGEQRPDPMPDVELGGPGTKNFYGQIEDEEYNKSLSGTKAIDTFDEMRRGDGYNSGELLVLKDAAGNAASASLTV